jgi:O-antigen/teichoic acid export membrane protein
VFGERPAAGSGLKVPRILERLRSGSVAGNTLGYTAAIVLSRLPPFLFLPILAAALPPSELGHYLTALILADLVQGLSALGMVQALFRYFSKAEGAEDRKDLLGTALCLGIAGSTAFVAIFVSAYSVPFIRGSVEAFRNLPPGAFALALTAGVTISLTSILNASLWAEQRSRAFLLTMAGGAVLEAALSGSMVYLHAVSLQRMLAIECAKDAAVAIGVAWCARRDLALRIEWTRLKSLLRFGVWFMPMGIFSWMLQSTDRFWLGQAASMADVGVYGFFYKLATPFTVLFQAYVLSMDSKLFKAEPAEAPHLLHLALRAYLKRAGALLVLAGMLVPAVMWVAIRYYGLVPRIYLSGLKVYPVLLGSIYFYYWAAHHAALMDYRLRSRKQLEFMACASIAAFALCPLAIHLGRRIGIEPLIAVAYANMAGVAVLLGLYVRQGEPVARSAWPMAVAPLLLLAAFQMGWWWAGP